MNDLTVLDKKFRPFIGAERIDKAVELMAEKINADYADENPFFIAILNGSFMFASDLLKKIKRPCNISFVKLSSYQGTKSTENVTTLIGINENIEGRRVIILEDIIDTGITLSNFLEVIKAHKPKDVRLATCLFKPNAFQKAYKIDYVGMEIPNDFIIGYGLDYNGYGRNLPDIYKITE
ncbi:MAG: hypoxanthine phosphoribosyltransferase [Bacteroidales bacterium]|nr:hypoxanthine phosphoribosyltransferase [Bacteroidales bacterium]